MEGFPENFLQSDGTIKLELDFTVDKVTFVNNGSSVEDDEEKNEWWSSEPLATGDTALSNKL